MLDRIRKLSDTKQGLVVAGFLGLIVLVVARLLQLIT
jgi:hypothetical protein